MKLRQRKSKWEVVSDGNALIYSTHKSRKAAEQAMELQQAYQSLANGWSRCTPRQRELLEADHAKRGVRLQRAF